MSYEGVLLDGCMALQAISFGFSVIGGGHSVPCRFLRQRH